MKWTLKMVLVPSAAVLWHYYIETVAKELRKIFKPHGKVAYKIPSVNAEVGYDHQFSHRKDSIIITAGKDRKVTIFFMAAITLKEDDRLGLSLEFEGYNNKEDVKFLKGASFPAGMLMDEDFHEIIKTFLQTGELDSGRLGTISLLGTVALYG